MSREQASRLIELLERVSQRPQLFFGAPDFQAAVLFLMGFAAALESAFGVDNHLAKRERVILERGWELPKATGPGIEGQMFQKGMSPVEVIQELVAVEIDLLQRMAGPSET